MVDFGMDPQTALDAPRFQVAGVDSAEGASCVEDSRCVLAAELTSASHVVCKHHVLPILQP